VRVVHLRQGTYPPLAGRPAINAVPLQPVGSAGYVTERTVTERNLGG